MLNQAQELIFERYKHPLFAGPVEGATHFAEGSNPVCGDELRIELRIADSTIQELRHQTRACAICTASADLLAESLQGEPLEGLAALDPEEAQAALGIPLSPVRLKCALLPLETIKLAVS